MDAIGWVLAIAQILPLQNWLVGPIYLIVFIPFYIFRVRAEEKNDAGYIRRRISRSHKKNRRVIPKF